MASRHLIVGACDKRKSCECQKLTSTYKKDIPYLWHYMIMKHHGTNTFISQLAMLTKKNLGIIGYGVIPI